MKQIYLRPRGRGAGELRSDTLFGLLTWAVRQVYGPDAVARFLAPMRRDPGEAPLVLSSAFPFVDAEGGRRHWFPRPLPWRAPGASPWIEDRELIAFVAGREVAAGEPPPAAHGLFFLADGPSAHYLDAALAFLENFGFGGAGSAGGGAFDVEVCETEFLRRAQPGERGLLLSLHAPTAAERRALVAAARNGGGVHYAIERRQGIAGGRFADLPRPRKRALLMLAEGSVLPCTGPGSAPEVGRAEDGDGGFPILQHGFGFFVPITGAAR